MSKLFPLLILLASGLTSLAQSTNPVVNKSDNSKSLNPSIKGVWKSIGNSYLLDARTDSIILYSTTSQHCYLERNAYLTGLLNNSAQFKIDSKKDTLSIYLQDFGEKTSSLQ